MTLGIGGAGSRLAYALDENATIVNVSQTELSKLQTPNRILAVVHSNTGQLRGSRKSPQIGRDAFQSVKREIMHIIPGNDVISSTGGGTGNGITASILEELSNHDDVDTNDKTTFILILPYAKLEAAEFVDNTTSFLQQPLSRAIDSGNTGNIFLFSNQVKFESRMTEGDYNRMLVESLDILRDIPRKGEAYKLLDGHIDYEDFSLFTSRPYFNHFTCFNYNPEERFESQLNDNLNPLLLTPAVPIEALFLLELPRGYDSTCFYEILEYFADNDVTPTYSVLENPDIDTPFVTVSLLYSRKPTELVEDFNRISRKHTQAKIRKSLEQHVSLPTLEVNLETEAKQAAAQSGAADDDILNVLRRLGKI